jgi:hypothetical protein
MAEGVEIGELRWPGSAVAQKTLAPSSNVKVTDMLV